MLMPTIRQFSHLLAIIISLGINKRYSVLFSVAPF